MKHLRLLILLPVVFYLTPISAYPELRKLKIDDYQLSLNKEKKQISVTKVTKMKSAASQGVKKKELESLAIADVKTPKMDKNSSNQEISGASEEYSNKTNPAGAITATHQDDETGKKTKLKSQRVRTFTEYFEADEQGYNDKEFDYKKLPPIEGFYREVRGFLDQAEKNANQSTSLKLTPKDQIKAQAISSTLANRIDRINKSIGSWSTNFKTQTVLEKKFTNASDLGRISETIEILDFAEKYLQAMGEL